LNHAIVGFGDTIHYELEKPTANIDVIRKAIDRLRVDETGNEKTMHALVDVIGRYNKLLTKDRKILIVLCTDESGDDGEYVEEARQAAVGRGVPIYVIGRQALFGYEWAHLLYIDPVTKDHYWPSIRRGPETAGKEALQWDGLHGRLDEQPSGFAPYELARLAKDTGGIYFLLPSEEEMRVRQREKAYSMATLKEYVPDYENRAAYYERIKKSEFRTALVEIIEVTKGFGFRQHFPILPEPLAEAVIKAGQESEMRLNSLLLIEKRLRSLEKLRNREPEKRWQAAYDLMLAQIVTYQVKAYEYRACLLEMVSLARKGQLRPKKLPTPELIVEWEINHSKARKAPQSETEKKYAEADRLLKLVIARHPQTPWSDLAQDEFNRGFGCQWGEWNHNPRYTERAKLVPKY
jgi:ribosomal protein L17